MGWRGGWGGGGGVRGKYSSEMRLNMKVEINGN